MARVLGLGYVPLDVWEGDEAPAPCVGGSTANTLALLSLLGHRATLLGAVGGGQAGRQCRAELANLGVDVDGVICRKRRRTKRIRITVGEEGERIFHISRRNVAQAPDRREIRCLGVPVEDFDCYHTALATRCSFDIARRSQWTSYNGQRCYGRKSEILLHRQLIEACRVIVLPAGYLSVLLGLKGEHPVEARVLVLFRQPELRIVTMGVAGLVVWYKGRFHYMPALDLKRYGLQVCDTTGAGDAFHAGLLHRLLRSGSSLGGWSERQVLSACRFGVQISAYACSRFGTKNLLDKRAYAEMFDGAPRAVAIDPDTPLFRPSSVRQPMCRGEG